MHTIKPTFRQAPNKSKGFNIVEVMMVVLVIGLLSALVLPNYAAYMRRGHRAEARAGLLNAQQWMERAATTGDYPAQLPQTLTWFENNKHYEIKLTPGVTPGYQLVAEPYLDAQKSDECGTFTLDYTGKRGIVNNKPSVTIEECWRR